MKIHFWSSTEYSGFMAGLIRELCERGLDARQRYQISEASYRAATSPAARLFLRFRQYVAYPVQLMAALGKRRLSSFRLSSGQLFGKSEQLETGKLKTRQLVRGHDVIVVSTNTFYAPLIATYLHPNVAHLVYDLFPEAMIHSGKWKEGSLKVKIVRWITRKTLQRASVNVFLGERLKQYVESIHGDCGRSAVIAVGADQSLFGRSPKERSEVRGQKSEARGQEQTRMSESEIALRQAQGSIKSTPSILYCGNFGNLHDSATLFDYWKNRSATLQRASSHACEAAQDSRISRNARGLTEASRGESEPCGVEAGAVALASSCAKAPAHREAARYVFHCSGPKRAALEAAVQQLPESLRATITIGGGLSQEEWTEAMEAADGTLLGTG